MQKTMTGFTSRFTLFAAAILVALTVMFPLSHGAVAAAPNGTAPNSFADLALQCPALLMKGP